MSVKVKINNVKSAGDSLCTVNNKDVYVPFVWYDEEVVISVNGNRGFPLEIVKPSPFRISPLCRYYTKCGGCKFQHIKIDEYKSFKVDSLCNTLGQKGVNANINPLISVPYNSRRRAEFACVSAGQSQWFGFNALKSSEIVAIKECPLLTDKINKALPAIRKLTIGFNGDVFVTELTNGLDILLTAKKYPDLAFLQDLAAFMQETETVKVSWRSDKTMPPEILLQTAVPKTVIAGKELEYPTGAFLQASQVALNIMTDLVLQALDLDKEKRIADFFAGLGSFALPIAVAGQTKSVKISAFDVFSPAIQALDRLKAKGIKAFARDLFAMPLSSDELNMFDAVVLDPPRAGAEAQVRQLALSTVRKVIYISCNPASFAKDAKVLTEVGGYTLKSITPIDQFVYSPHLEAVSVFTK